jgi:phage-related holin
LDSFFYIDKNENGVSVLNFYSGIFNFSNLFNTKTGMAAFISTPLGYYLTLAYGEDINLLCMVALALLVTMDWMTGIVAATKDKTLSSAYGLQGVVRTFVILLLPAFATIIDKIFGLPNIMFFMFWGGIVLHTLVSFAANSERIGWNRWIPQWALNAVASEIQAKIQRSQERLPSPGAPIDKIKETEKF